MKTHRRIAAGLGIVASLIFAGTALANTAVSPACGTVEFDHAKGLTVVLEPGDLGFGPFASDAVTEKVAPGDYTFQFYAGESKQASGSVTVAPCATPTPTVTPTPVVTPTPTHKAPTPTPPVTSKATAASDVASPGYIEMLTLVIIGIFAVAFAMAYIASRSGHRRKR